MKTLETLTLKFGLDSETDIVDVTSDWDLDNVSPLLAVKALRDLADEEERSYLTWIGRREGLNESFRVIQEERNRVVKNGVN